MTQTTDEAVEAAVPDMTGTIILDMVEGVKRYIAIAEDSAESAARHRLSAESQDESEIEYRAKAAALSGVIRDLGYDPETGEPVATGG